MVRAAGALVWRFKSPDKAVKPGEPISPSDIEVLLVHRPRYRDWSWPKGKAERNETIPVAAVREVEEETGVTVTLGASLTTQRYRLGSGHLKEVYYWSGQVLQDGPAYATRPPVVPASKKEIDVVQWVGTDEARHKLTRRGDRRLLTELINRGARGELDTSTIILLRHARAKERRKWVGDEGDRPLTRMGVAQARDLVPLLSAFGADRIISSPWRRCVQTVAPYAALGPTKLKTREFLSEDGVDADADASTALVRKLLNKKSGSRVISLHKPGYEALLQPIQEYAPRRLLTVMAQPQRSLRKAEMLVAHVSHNGHPRIFAVERHMPFTHVQFS